MADEDAELNETIDHLGEASRRVRAARRLLPHRASVDAPNCLRQEARPSKALDATEAAHREAHRRGDCF
jgi:hypothetical protein